MRYVLYLLCTTQPSCTVTSLRCVGLIFNLWQGVMTGPRHGPWVRVEYPRTFTLPYSRNGGKKGGARGLSETAGWTSVMALLGDSGPPHYCTSIHSWCTRRASCVDLIIKKQKKWGIVGTWYLTWARTSYVTQIALATENWQDRACRIELADLGLKLPLGKS